ncbi:hypothetical protein LK533_17620 [Sphingomonas sp. PL-96]|uniref:hypothetical protein n=1 Tax=Sphingomonas sp. PL-96 TaxID=2887201 RepID=UPI001E3BC197|nr:hypothetical protein [Sphingomonas sp. PL-96]MCC2978473.1 hypothetical protein [Sphingomonas sp. PL-96]
MSTSLDSHRRRLQQDIPTGIAAFVAFLALLLPTIGVVTLLVKGPQIEARGNPLYWLILSVPAIWAWRMTDYSPGVLRTIRPILFAAPLIAGGVLAAARVRDAGMTPYWIMLALTCVLTVAGGLLYNRSLLAREGPIGAE